MFTKAVVVGLTVAALSGTATCAGEGLGGPAGGGPMGIGQRTYREIQIESDPPGAVVWIDGRRFGTTPQAIRVDNDHRTIQVILSKPGYLQTGGELDLTTLTEPVTVIHEDLGSS